MGREIRRVPKDWVHPKIPRTNKYEPMLQNYAAHLDDYLSEMAHVASNLKKIMTGEPVYAFNETFTNAQDYYDEAVGRSFGMPKPQDFMPTGTCYQLYEDVSEGTPLSDVYETANELIEHLTTKGDFWDSTPWDMSAAVGLVDMGFVPTAVFMKDRIFQPNQCNPTLAGKHGK